MKEKKSTDWKTEISDPRHLASESWTTVFFNCQNRLKRAQDSWAACVLVERFFSRHPKLKEEGNMSYSPMNDAVLAGVPRLLDDLQKLLETHDHADILFLVGREETAFYAHRLLLNSRYAIEMIYLSLVSKH